MKVLLLLFLGLIISCKQTSPKEPLASKKTVQNEITKRDTIFLHKTKSSLSILNSLTNFKLIQVEDQLYLNGLKFEPFYGSSISKSSFSKYYMKIEKYDPKGINSFYLSKNLKTTIVNLNFCYKSNDQIKSVIEGFEFIGSRTYPMDGGAKDTLKYYCNKDNVVVLLFTKAFSNEDITPICNIKNETPMFLKKIYITEKDQFKKNLLELGANLFVKDNMFEKTKDKCN